MNSGLERGAMLAGLLVLLLSLQFGLGVAGDFLALPGAALLGAAGALVWVRLHLPQGRAWVPPVVVAGAVLVSTLVLEFAYRASFAQWFAPLLAGGGAAVAMAVGLRNRIRCGLCNRRLKSQAVTFRCPRCMLLVCDETCWSFEHRRCQMCLENRVPVLPVADSWWNRVTGPRSMQGRCQICLASGEQADLRACAKCRRLQCRGCWDFSNGECSRCGTALPELPASLRLVVAEAAGEGHTLPLPRTY